jgi:repressor LexA
MNVLFIQNKTTVSTTINQRIKKIIEVNKLNVYSFSKKIGATNSTLSSMFEKDTKPSYDLIMKIAAVFTEINMDWLLKDVGPMLKSNNSIPFNSSQNYISVPVIPFDAIAGYNGHDNEGVGIEQCERYCIPEFNMIGVDFLVRVRGNSMYPKYSNGDLLACKKIQEILFFQWGKVYVIDGSQGAMIKRIYEDKENPDLISCVSDNKEHYPAFSIPKDDIRSLSMVLGVIRTE